MHSRTVPWGGEAKKGDYGFLILVVQHLMTMTITLMMYVPTMRPLTVLRASRTLIVIIPKLGR